jgi:hypothetical protein
LPDSEDEDPRLYSVMDRSSDDTGDDGIRDDEIVQEIEKWKADTQERRLQLLEKAAVSEIDPWLQYTHVYRIESIAAGINYECGCSEYIDLK